MSSNNSYQERVVRLQQYDRVAFHTHPMLVCDLSISASHGTFAQLQLLCCLWPGLDQDVHGTCSDPHRTGLFHPILHRAIIEFKMETTTDPKFGAREICYCRIIFILRSTGYQYSTYNSNALVVAISKPWHQDISRIALPIKKALWRILCPPAPIRD